MSEWPVGAGHRLPRDVQRPGLDRWVAGPRGPTLGRWTPSRRWQMSGTCRSPPSAAPGNRCRRLCGSAATVTRWSCSRQPAAGRYADCGTTSAWSCVRAGGSERFPTGPSTWRAPLRCASRLRTWTASGPAFAGPTPSSLGCSCRSSVCLSWCVAVPARSGRPCTSTVRPEPSSTRSRATRGLTCSACGAPRSLHEELAVAGRRDQPTASPSYCSGLGTSVGQHADR